MSARRRIIPIFVPHWGCRHECVFCNQKRISGQETHAAAADVRRAAEGAQGVEMAFYGGSFTAIPVQEQEELLDAALPFLHAGTLSALRVSTRPDAIDGETLARLRRFGVETIELGAQSMRDEVLLRTKRGHTAADVRRAAAAVKAAGFQLILQMMTGLPGDDDDGAVYTARELIALQPDGVRIYPTVVVRDTELYALWQAGAYRAHTVEDAVRVCARLVPLFRAAGIPIIRLGLNPTDVLSAGAAAAGAYHPALGELVLARIALEQMRALLAAQGDVRDCRAVFAVPPGGISQAVGQKRSNVAALCREFGLRDVRICPQVSKTGEISLISVAK